MWHHSQKHFICEQLLYEIAAVIELRSRTTCRSPTSPGAPTTRPQRSDPANTPENPRVQRTDNKDIQARQVYEDS